MTYRQLLHELQLLSDEQLDTPILVFARVSNTFTEPIVSVNYTTMEEEDTYQIVSGRPYISL